MPKKNRFIQKKNRFVQKRFTMLKKTFVYDIEKGGGEKTSKIEIAASDNRLGRLFNTEPDNTEPSK